MFDEQIYTYNNRKKFVYVLVCVVCVYVFVYVSIYIYVCVSVCVWVCVGVCVYICDRIFSRKICRTVKAYIYFISRKSGMGFFKQLSNFGVLNLP